MRVSCELFKMMREGGRGLVWTRMREGEGWGRVAQVSGLQHSGITRLSGRHRASFLLTRLALTYLPTAPPPTLPAPPILKLPNDPRQSSWARSEHLYLCNISASLPHSSSSSFLSASSPGTSSSSLLPCVFHSLNHSQIIYLSLLRFVSVAQCIFCCFLPCNSSLRNLSVCLLT